MFDQPFETTDSHVVMLLKNGLRRLKQGWIKGTAVRGKINNGFYYCMAGALTIDDTGKVLSHFALAPATEQLKLAVVALTRGRYQTVPAYNDAWVRTQSDCELAYAVAIELQERTERSLPT